MSDPNVKNIIVTGDAAKVNGLKRRRRTLRRMQDGGGEVPSTPMPTSTPVTANVIKQLNQQPGSIKPLVSAQVAGSPATAEKSKISLIPAKNRNKTRVLLTPKNVIAPATHSKTKKQKKLSLRVSNVRRKMASTRKHIHASTSLPLDKIRKELVDAKLLNPASKAPEALIRKIYADFKITTNKA